MSGNMFGRRRSEPPKSAPTPPAPQFTQDQLRERRRRWLSVHYGGDFSLTDELSELVSPLAQRVAALRSPLVLHPEIIEVADAVHEVVSMVVGALAESKLDADATARTARAARDLAQRPTAPTVSDDEIISGTWAATLIAFAAPLSDDFAAYLARALPERNPRQPDRLTASERLVEHLRLLDTAVGELGQRLTKAEAAQARPTIEELNEMNRAKREQERIDQALARIGARA